MTPHPQTPSAVRWLIGTELRRYRKAVKVSASRAAALINSHESKISHIEAGRYRQDPAEVAALAEFYGASASVVDRLVALAARDDESTWWAPYSSVVPDWLQTYVGLEHLADAATVYEPLALPGLLQTEEYAVALTAASPRVRPDRARRLVEFRLERQRRLSLDQDGDPLELTAVVEESALRRPVGPPGIRRAQFERLLELGDQPNVALHVLPADLPAHAAMAGRFTLLQFSQVRPIVYVELSDSALYLQDPDDTSAYTMSAESLVGAALDWRDTRSLITSLIAELG